MDYAYDFSTVPGPDPVYLSRIGAHGILVYSFGARQSDDYLDRCRKLGMKVVWVWERDTDSIFGGYDYAVRQCEQHEASAKAGELSYVACDTNDGGVNGRDMTPFLQGWADTTREPMFGVYGSSGAYKQARAFGGKCQRFWGVVNWINGGGPNNAPENIRYWSNVGADLVQLIGSPVANTDQNMILTPVWHATESPPPTQPEVDMVLYTTTDDGVITYWRADGGYPVKLAPEEAAVYYPGIVGQWIKVIPMGGALSMLAYGHHTADAHAFYEAK